MSRKIFIIISFFLFPLTSWAQEVEFTLSAPRVVEAGEQFRLTYVLNKRGENLQLPKLEAFDILFGPSTSSSTSMQIINGKTTRSSTFSYTYIVQATKTGKFTIPPATIKVDNKSYQSNSHDIEVVPGRSSKSTQGTTPQDSQDKEQYGSIDNEDLFVKVSVDKESVYQSEQILATIKVYTNLNLSNFGDIKFPSFAGFWTQDIELPGQIRLYREAYNGVIYNVGTLKKTLLFPQQTGEITIDPFELECFIRQRISSGDSFFDDFFDNYRTVKTKVTSKPVKIKVKSFPGGAPQSFNGAVGKFSMKATLDNEQVKANEAITLKINLTGTGNIKLIDAPKVDFPADFELYDPKSDTQTSASEKGLSGTKKFEYLFIPRYEGDYTIPEFKFSYFDPSIRKYKTSSAGPFSIKVEKGDVASTPLVISSYSKEDVKFLGKDIRFIKTGKTKLIQKGYTFFGSRDFYLAYLAAIVVFMILFFFNRQRIKQNADVAGMKTKRANKFARKRLREAGIFLKADEKERFYDSVLRAFWGYLSDKLQMPLAELNRENATTVLAQRQAKEETINQFKQLLDTCEFARFAPSENSLAMHDIYNEAEQVMSQLEKQIR